MLDQLQQELAQEDVPVVIEILGVNEVGHESGNDGFTAGRDLPWLQESKDHSIWNEWGVVYRDVFIVDEKNEVIEVYNLTDNDLNEPANYDALLDLFLAAAGG